MKTSGIHIPFAEAEAPLIKASLGWRGLPHQDGQEPFSMGRWSGGEISKYMKTGWIFFNLPAGDPTDLEQYVNAKVWTGYSHFLRERGHERAHDNTFQASFPAGVIDESDVYLSIVRRELVGHKENFYSSHDTSLPVRELFDRGLAWLLVRLPIY